MGAQIVVEGQLDKLPLPARPDEYQYVVALSAPPTLLNEVALEIAPDESALASLQGPPCDFSSFEALEPISFSGTLVAIDDSAAAGIAGELERDGCHVRLWIESRYWDEWSQAERARFAEGEGITVDGILTYVLGEAVIDLADPPIAD